MTLKIFISAALLLILAACINGATIPGIYTDSEHGSNARLYLCPVECHPSVEGKVCYEGAITKMATDGTTLVPVGVVSGASTDNKVLKGIWVEAGGAFGEMELDFSTTAQGFSGFYRYADGFKNQEAKEDWTEKRVSEGTPTGDQCLMFGGVSEMTQPIKTLTDTVNSLQYTVCHNGDDDAIASAIYTNTGAGNDKGTQSGKLFKLNGNYVWAGTFVQRINGARHSFAGSTGGAFIYKTVNNGMMKGADWYQPNGLYTHTERSDYTSEGMTSMTMGLGTSTYDECYGTDNYYWFGTFNEVGTSGRTFFCPQPNGKIFGSYNRGYSNLETSMSVGKYPNMIGFQVAETNVDDTQMTGTWYEPDAVPSHRTGVFQWDKINSTHFATKWWYGTDKSGEPEAHGMAERLSNGYADLNCHSILSPAKTLPSFKTSDTKVSVSGSKVSINSAATGNSYTFSGTQYLNSVVVGTLKTSTDQNYYGIFYRPATTNSDVLVSGFVWGVSDGSVDPDNFIARTALAHVSAASNLLTVNVVLMGLVSLLFAFFSL